MKSSKAHKDLHTPSSTSTDADLRSSSGAASRVRTRVARELCVIVSCHHVLCAIPTRWVHRLVLPDEVNVESTRRVLSVGQERFVMWDLGERLGLGPLDASWCLLYVPRPSGRDVPIALSTGACQVVAPLPECRALPRTLFEARADAILGVFVADAAHGGALHGVELDVRRLWTPAELAASEALLRGGNS